MVQRGSPANGYERLYKNSLVMLDIKKELNKLLGLKGRRKLVKKKNTLKTTNELYFMLSSGKNKSNYQSALIWILGDYHAQYDENEPIYLEVVWLDKLLEEKIEIQIS